MSSCRTKESARAHEAACLLALARTLVWAMVIFTARPAWGQAADVSLGWSAPAGCPSSSEVLARIRRLIAASGSQADAGQSWVAGQVTREASGFALSLVIETATDRITRELRSHDCTVLSTSAAVLVALAITPQAPALPASVEAASVPPLEASVESRQDNAAANSQSDVYVAPTPTTLAATPLARSVEQKEPRLPADFRRAVWASVGGGLLGTGLPGPRPELFAELGFDARSLSVGVRLGHVFAMTHNLNAESSTRMLSQFLALTGCRRWGTRRFTGGPCASLLGTRIRGSSRGLLDARDRNALWGQIGLGAELRLRVLRRTELSLASGMLLPLSPRPRFEVDAYGSVELGAIVSGYTHSAILVRFD